MNSDYAKVLAFLAEETSPHGEMCLPFAPICLGTKLDRRRVRVICRALARKGLTEFYSGLCDSDGGFRGAGYCLTDAGRLALSTTKDGE